MVAFLCRHLKKYMKYFKTFSVRINLYPASVKQVFKSSNHPSKYLNQTKERQPRTASNTHQEDVKSQANELLTFCIL